MIVRAGLCVLMMMLVTGVAKAAGDFFGPQRIWVKVAAKPHESRWQACRRVYKSSVYRVRGGSGNIVHCWVDHSQANRYGSRSQNFNE